MKMRNEESGIRNEEWGIRNEERGMRNEDERTFTFFCTCVRHIALLLLTLPATAVACKTQQSSLNQPQIKKKIDRELLVCLGHFGEFWEAWKLFAMQNAQLLILFPYWGHLHSLHFEQVFFHFLSCKVMMGMLVIMKPMMISKDDPW